MNHDDILDGLEDVLDGIDAEVPTPTASPTPKKTRAKRVAAAIAPVAQVEAAAPTNTPPTEPEIDPLSKQHGFCGKRVKIIIDRGHSAQDQTTVFLRSGDYTCRIDRGHAVTIPVEMLEVLNHAEQTVFSQPTDGVLIPHDSIRFPYRIVA